MEESISFVNKPDIEDSITNEEAIPMLQSSDIDSLSDDDIDDASNRQVPNPSLIRIATWKVTVNIVDYLLGVEVLAMPYAVAKGGITAVLFLFVIPLIYWYANKVIIGCLYDQGGQIQKKTRARATWKDIGEVLSPKYGGFVVIFLQNFTLFVASITDLIACGSLMLHILPSWPVTQAIWCAIATLLAFPTTFIKSYGEMAWLSVFSIVTISGSIGVIFWQSVANVDKWDITAIFFWDSEGVLISLGILLYSCAYFELIPSLEGCMEQRAQIGKSMAWAMLIVGGVNVTISLGAFLCFGFDTDEIVINNLPSGPIRTIIVIGFEISLLVSFSMPLQPIFLLVEESGIFQNLCSKCSYWFCYISLRIFIVSATLAMAILIPHFALMSFIDGVATSPVLAFIIPCLVYCKVRRYQLNTLENATLSFLFAFGVAVIVLSVVLFIAKAI